MDQWNGQQRVFAIEMFYDFFNLCWVFKSSRFFVSPCTNCSTPIINIAGSITTINTSATVDATVATLHKKFLSKPGKMGE